MLSVARAKQHKRLYAWAITSGLLVVAASLIVLQARTAERAVSDWQLLAILFVGFVLGEAITVRLEFGRQGIVASVVEIPLLLAFFLLSPLGVLLARIVASIVVQAWRTRDLTKFVFNVASIAAATAVANAVVAAFGPLSIERPSDWLVALAAILAVDLVTYLAVSAVISVFQSVIPFGVLLRNTVQLLPGMVFALTGLLLLLAIRASVWSVLLMLAMAGVVALGYRAYARFVAQHENLGNMYDLAQVLPDVRSEGELADILLNRARTLLRAEFATLWLPARGRHPELQLTAKEGVTGLLDQSPLPPELRRRVISSGHPVVVGPRTSDDDLRVAIRNARLKDAVVVPLRSGNATIGCLEWVNRLGDAKLFTPVDVRLMEGIAAQTGVAVENTRLVERLRFDAYHDSLTALPNRARMVAAVEEAVRIAVPNEVVALLIFDVDGLRDVNKSLGHEAGDQLLTVVGRRLAECAPDGALLARVGGDEFALLLRIADIESVVDLAGQLRTALQDPMPFGSSRLDVDTSVGVAVHPDHGSDPELLLQRADLAAQTAKSSQQSVQVFNLGLESRSVRRLGLAGDLRRAIEAGELEVHFQPKISLAHRVLVGVECLARWRHPTHGWVSPEDFVPVAEHTGLLGRLTDLVLREGLRRCRRWSDEGHALTVSVNLSPRTLMDPAFVGYLEALLSDYQVPADRLTLEITGGGALLDTERPLPTLRRIRELGVRLSVDDFGTAHSSLADLRRLPVQEVKIDRSFVQGMATDPGEYAIVKAIVDLARTFSLHVVAEGVESELALSQLQEMGCDVGQGFFFSRPLSSERLDAWLSARTELTAEADRRLRVVP